MNCLVFPNILLQKNIVIQCFYTVLCSKQPGCFVIPHSFYNLYSFTFYLRFKILELKLAILYLILFYTIETLLFTIQHHFMFKNSSLLFPSSAFINLYFTISSTLIPKIIWAHFYSLGFYKLNSQNIIFKSRNQL